MAIVTYPLDNIEYSAMDAELYHYGRSNGVFSTDDFSASATGSDNYVTISPGVGWISNDRFSGKVIGNRESETLSMRDPDLTHPRIDAIVLRFDVNENKTKYVVKKGTAKTNPSPPSVVRSGSVWELHLYHVYRKPGSTFVSQSDITDLRTDTKYCGIVSSSISGYALPLLGGEMQGDIAMGGHKISGLSAPAYIDDAATKAYADSVARNLISMGAKIETWNTTVSYNKQATHEFSGNVQAVIVGLQLTTGGAMISAIWSKNMSGIQQNCYGRLGNGASDTWKTTVKIDGKKVTISRDATTTLEYYVAAILADVSETNILDDGQGNVTFL